METTMESVIEEEQTHSTPEQASALPLLPQTGDPLHALEQYHRYLYASRFVRSKRVLDVACGDGYGTAFLSLNAADVLGIAADELKAMQAREKYTEFPKARFSVGRIEDGFPSVHDAEVVVAFGVLEKLEYEARHRFMNNVKGLMKAGGVAVIASSIRSLSNGTSGSNGHTQPFSPVEFSEFLKEYFRNSIFVGQKPVTVSSIWSLYQWNDDYFRFHTRDNLFTLPPDDEQFADPSTIIAICSDDVLSREIADNSKSFYFDTAQFKRTEEILSKTQSLEEDVRSLEGFLGGLRNEVAERNVSIERLQLELEESRRRIATLELNVIERDSTIVTLRNDLESAHGSLETLQQAYDLRTARANGLKEEQAALSARLQETERSLREVQQSFEERSQQAQLLEQENSRLRGSVADLEQRLANQTSEIMGGNDEFQRLQLTMTGLQEELVERRETAILHAEEITALQAQVLGLQTVLDEKDTHVSASAEELAAYKEEIRLLHEHMKEHQHELTAATNDLNQLRHRNAELEEQFGAHASIVKERDERIHRLQARLKELETSVHDHSHLIAKHKRETEEMQAKLNEAQKAAAGKSEAVAAIKKELDDQRHQSDALNKEIADRVQRILYLEKQVKEQTEFLANIQRESDSSVMTARQLRAELDKQVMAFDTYQKSQSDLQQRYSRSQIKVQELQATTAMIEAKLARVASAPAYKFLASIGFIPNEKV